MKTTHVLRSLSILAALAAVAPAQSSITTLFAGGNGGSAGWMNMFDITPNIAVTITSFDLNLSSAAGTGGTIDVYITAAGGTYVGNQNNAGAWTLVSSSASFSAAGTGLPTNAVLNTPIVLTPGTYGIAILFNGVGMNYTNGNGTNQSYSNADLSLALGSSTTGLFTGLYDPRVWNGTIYYQPGANYASATPYGSGCGATPKPSLYELFDGTTNAFDLSNSGFTLNRGPGAYAFVQGASPIVAPTGAAITFGDDDTQQIALPWAMPYANGMTSSVWVCSNGFISLEMWSGASFTESVTELLSSPPRVCPLWDDLNPSAAGGGTINAEQDAGNPSLFHVTFTGVPEYTNTGSNTFQVTFSQSGNIEVKYGACSSLDSIVGYSQGGNASDPGSSDLSTLMATALSDGYAALALAPGARPVIGTSGSVETQNIPATALGGVLALGVAPVMPPIDLSIIGMPGCTLNAGFNAQFGFATLGATASSSIPVPMDPSLAGVHVYLQSLVVAPGVNPLGISATNGIDWKLDVN